MPRPPSTARPTTPFAAALAAVSCAVLGGCATQPAEPIHPDIAEPFYAAVEPFSQFDTEALRSASEATLLNRRASTVANGTILVFKSALIEPLIRPFSTVKALYSVVLKSTVSFSRRIAIDTVQFDRLESQPIPEIADRPGMDLVAWERDLDTLAGIATKGTVRFLIDGDEFFPRLKETIIEAEDSIDVRTYIFDNDDVAVEIADMLRERSAEVDVRVLLDGIGALLGTQVDPEGMPHDFSPPISMPSYLQRGSPVKVRTSGNPWLTGDHTKSTIIDGRLAFLGGMNIGREYRYDWHDLMVEVEGPIVDVLQRDLDIAWSKAGWLGDLSMTYRAMATPKPRADDVGEPVRVILTRDHDSQIYRAQLAAIRRAQRYIYVENSYFSDDATLYELAKARRRGVDVRVILPDDGNHGALNYSNQVAINAMLRNGIRVFLFPGMTHVKAMIVDGWASVGSANFDKLSLQINEELNIATSNEAVVADLMQRVFVEDFAVSAEVTEPRDLTLRHHFAEFVSDELL